jgi:hypothetical protein
MNNIDQSAYDGCVMRSLTVGNIRLLVVVDGNARSFDSKWDINENFT